LTIRVRFPKRAQVYCSSTDVNEDLDTFRKELALMRLVGANGCGPLGRLQEKRAEMGFTCCYFPNFLALQADWDFDAQAVSWQAASAAASYPKGQPAPMILADEPFFAEIPKGPALDKRFAAWLQAKGLQPVELGAGRWEDVKCIVPNPSQPKLSALSHEFQAAEEIRWWNGWALALKKCAPTSYRS